MADNFDVFLRFILDDDAAAKTKAGAKDVLSSVEKASDQSAKNISKNLDRVAIDAAKANIALLTISESLSAISKRGLLLSGGLLTGAFAWANKYVKDATEATETTVEWTRQTDRLKASNDRVGAALAREALPLLRIAAGLAERASTFVESNPEIIRAGLKAGVVVAGLSAVGLAVSKGIRFIADASMIASTTAQLLAARTMDSAANKQLAAAGGMQAGKIPGIGTVGGLAAGGTVATAASVLAIVTTVLAGAGIGALVYDQIAKATGGTRLSTIASGGAALAGQTLGRIGQAFGMSPEEAERKTLVFTALIARLTGEIDESSPLWLRAAELANQTTGQIKDAVQQLSDTQMALVDAYADMKGQMEEAERRFGQERIAIIRESLSSALNAARSNASAIRAINERADTQRAQILSNAAQESIQAAAQYEQQRAQIIRDGAEEVQRIEERRLEELRKLEIDHNDRVDELTANRDALGLVLEQRRYNREKDEINRQAEQETARRRQETAIRLQELAQSYALERAQRQAQLAQQLKDNEEQRKLELQQQAEQYRAEMRQIFEQRTARLRDLQDGLNAERSRIRESFIAQVRDLDAALLGEQNTKRQYYAAMLRDAEAFLASYRSTLNGIGTGSTPRSFNTGGYTGNEIIRTHGREFVTNNPTTRALEAMIGGQLTQQALLRAVARGTVNSVVWNDRRRFSGEYTMSMRKAMQRDTLSLLSEVLA